MAHNSALADDPPLVHPEHSATPLLPTLPLLTTKLFAPRSRSDRVARPHLIARLDAGLAHPLTLVCAPAGFGKTTLLTEWLQPTTRPMAWLSLDSGDNDPATFLRYLVAALQTVSPTLGEKTVALLEAPRPVPPAALLTFLINDLATLNTACILVLDDYHVVQTAPVQQMMTFLLQHLPPQLHLVIATREYPALPLAKLRAQGAISELWTADLRFTPVEAASLLTQVMALPLNPADVTALAGRTEGWVAGLQLAALSMQGRMDLPQFVAAFTGSHRHIMDYLTDEVLEQRPAGTKNFLLQTAILNRLSGPLCNAVTGENDGQNTLERLERANLFLVPLDDQRRWYRYHHLFADLLRTHLQQSQPDLIPQLHVRASRWFEQNDLGEEAIDHALAAPDMARAADLVEQISLRIFSEGHNATVHRWLDRLPDALVRQRPSLCLLYAAVLTAFGRFNEVERYFDSALLVAAATPLATEIAGGVALLRAGFAAYHGDADRTLALTQTALAYVPDAHPSRSLAMLTLGSGHLMRGELTAAWRAYQSCISSGDSARDLHAPLFADYFCGEIQRQQGLLHRAAQTFQRLLHHAERLPLAQHYWIACYLHNGLAKLHYEWNDLTRAADHIASGFNLSHYGMTERALVELYLTQARLQQAQGDMNGAFTTLDQVDHFVQQVNLNPLVTPIAPLRVRLWLAQGDLVAARRWAVACGLHLDDADAGLLHPIPYEVEYLTLVRVYLAQGHVQAVLSLLARLLAAATEAGRINTVIEIHLLQALALAAQGQLTAALSALQQALTLAEPAGYVRLFVDEGEPLAALLRQAQVHGIAADYVRQLLAAFGEPLADIARLPAPPAPPELLSERESDVLHLLAQGCSSQEVAERLIISVHTARTHIKNIYTKLEVHDRVQAVVRATELKLLVT